MNAIEKFKAEQASRVVVVNLENVDGETGYAFVRNGEHDVQFGPVRWSQPQAVAKRAPGRPKSTRFPDYPPDVSHLKSITLSLCRGDLSVMDRVEVTPMDWGRLTGIASSALQRAIETGDLQDAMAQQHIVTLGARRICAPEPIAA